MNEDMLDFLTKIVKEFYIVELGEEYSTQHR